MGLARTSKLRLFLIGLLMVWPGLPAASDPADRALEWTLASAEELSWEDAAAICADLTAHGHDDWRLPDIEELTLEKGFIPAELNRQLEEDESEAWACNRPTPPPDLAGTETHIEQVLREQAELARIVRQLCELEGGSNCRSLEQPLGGRVRRWTYRFGSGPENAYSSAATTLCVRGAPRECQDLDSSWVRCLQAVLYSGRFEDPRPGVEVLGLNSDGTRSSLGRTNDQGRLCLHASDAERHSLILTCEGEGCGALDPRQGRTQNLLILDPPQYGNRPRASHLCLTAHTGHRRICGARLRSLQADGTLRKLGRTGPSGRRCVKRKRLQSAEALLVCTNAACRLLPRKLLQTSNDLALILPDQLPHCREPRRSACPKYCDVWIH